MGWLSNLRIFLVSATAVILICIAVAFSLLRAVLPHATGYAVEIEQEISKQLGLPITIGSLDADMSWLTPRLRLIDVVIFNEDGKTELIRFDEALFALSYFETVKNLALSVGKISLVGADITLERKSDNQWLVQGLEIKRDADVTGSERLAKILLNTNIALLDSNIYWRDHTNRTEDMDFQGVNISTENLFGDHSLEIEVLLPESIGQTLRLVVILSGTVAEIENSTSRAYFDVTSLNVEAALAKAGIKPAIAVTGVVDAQLWFEFAGRNITQFAGNVLGSKISLTDTGPHNHQWEANEITGEFIWRRSENGWRIDIEDFLVDRGNKLWVQPAKIITKFSPEAGMQLSASYIRLADFYFLPEIFIRSEETRQLPELYDAISAVDIYNLHVMAPMKDGKIDVSNINADAIVNDLDINYQNKKMSLTGLDARVSNKDNKVTLMLASSDVKFKYGDMFRDDLEANTINGVISIARASDHLKIESDAISVANADIQTMSRVNIIIPDEGGPVLDLQTDYKNGIAVSASKYLPVSIMSEKLVTWLDNALLAGTIESGGFLFYGEASAFPFGQNQGVMQAQFDVKNTKLKFLDGWPELTDLSARVRFENASFSVAKATGKTYGARLDDVAVSIADLYAPNMTISGTIKSTSENFQHYVWNSGLNNLIGDAMRHFEASGNAATALNLEISLMKDDKPVLASGEIALDDNVFYLPAAEHVLTGISGKLAFTNDSLSASNINALLGDDEITIDIATVKNESEHTTVFNLTGSIKIDYLLKNYNWVPEDWLTGASVWNIGVQIPYGDKEYGAIIEMHSSFKGVELAISDRLNKPAEQWLPVDVVIRQSDEKLLLAASSSNIFELAGEKTNNFWRLNLDSAYLKGIAEFAADLDIKTTVSLDLDYIDLPALYRNEGRGPAGYALEPTDFPSLDVKIKTLDWDQLNFNDITLATSWNAHGMLIDNIMVNAPSLNIKGNGSWLKSWNNLHESSFNLTVNSENFGDALNNLGFAGAMNGGNHYSTISWKWPAEPYRFDIADVEGVAHVELNKGEIVNVKPGAGGRLLGLLNILHLPRRLMLDFGDVTSKGFVFDAITGDFKYKNGIAETDNTYISSTAADIKMTGKVGLVDRNYDLEVLVQPHSSAATFAGGTIYGGPVVGAGLVLLQKLFGIETISRDEFTITGPWNDPVVTQTAKRDPDAVTQDDDQ